jgi:hypothetical protein
MSVSEVVHARDIAEVLHFTTNKGLLGILASGRILSRARLGVDKYVEHVYEPNAEVRRDGPWLDYVNLSISRLNWEFFGYSRRWHAHQDVWWCALSIAPDVLALPGATFTTTNNIYSGCRRATGADGLEAMFAESMVRWPGNVVKRPSEQPEDWTTCHQAEVLVPGEVGVEHVRALYVATHAHGDIVSSQCEILLNDPDPLPTFVDPDIFEPHFVLG